MKNFTELLEREPRPVRDFYREHIYWPIKRLWSRRKPDGRLWRSIERNDHKWRENPRKNPLVAGWYSLNGALAWTILPAIDLMIARNHGHPIDMDEDEWLDTLTQIRNGFQAHMDLEDCPDNWEELAEERDKGLALFAKHYADLWD